MIDQVYYKEHTFLSSHKLKMEHHRAISGCGTTEEFGIGIFDYPGPLGYEDAKIGGKFLKIGVGILEKSFEKPYHFNASYNFFQPGDWDIQYGDNWIKFTQEIKNCQGWGYHYTKRVSLIDGRPEIIIARTLKNIGDKTIDTIHYGHNFMLLDGERLGSNYILKFPFTPKPTYGVLKKYCKLQDNRIEFISSLPKDAVNFTSFTGFSKSVKNNCFVIENTKTGTGVKIKGDLPLSAFHLFMMSTTLCPEPFVRLIINPGKTVKWETKYTFYELNLYKTQIKAKNL